MAQMTEALANAIIAGDGLTRSEIEQLCHFFLRHSADLARLTAELERLRKDAERIEFMSSHARQVVKNWEWVGSTGFRQAIDTQIRLNEKAADDQADAIDAAIAAEGKKK